MSGIKQINAKNESSSPYTRYGNNSFSWCSWTSAQYYQIMKFSDFFKTIGVTPINNIIFFRNTLASIRHSGFVSRMLAVNLSVYFKPEGPCGL